MSDSATRYPGQTTSAAEALAGIRPGRRLFIGSGCASPRHLVRELMSRACPRIDTELLHVLTLGDELAQQLETNPHYVVNSLLLTDNVRDAVSRGAGDYSPIAFSDLPNLLYSGEMQLEAALIQVSSPDDAGMMSLGISVDVTRAAVENARIVVAQVNRHMPRTHGNSLIHLSDVDYLVYHDEPLVEYDAGSAPAEAAQIGEYLCELVDDGATIAAGLGRMVSSVLPALERKRDLGIHTELITDPLMRLIESGAVTGARKTLDVGKVVASFAMGSAGFYEKLRDNTLLSFQSTDYVNDPSVIARQRKMTSISSATQIDLTGQVCADSVGSTFYSGVGGIMDFNRGAARARAGKPIVVMSATAQHGAFSRIEARLSPGAGATTTRADVHYVVTEYGVAFLHGKTIQERALSLINLAHPRFREQLLEQAINAGYVHPRVAAHGTRLILAPRASHSSALLHSGTQLCIRAVRATDEHKLRQFVAEHCRSKFFQDDAAAVYVNHRDSETILATLPASDGEDIVGVASYRRRGDTLVADAACVVAAPWSTKEIAPALLQHLGALAQGREIERLDTEVDLAKEDMTRAFGMPGAGFELQDSEDALGRFGILLG